MSPHCRDPWKAPTKTTASTTGARIPMRMSATLASWFANRKQIPAPITLAKATDQTSV